MNLVGYQIIDRVAVITLQNPPVNALSNEVKHGLQVAALQAIADPGADAIVLIGAGDTFVAGTDIRELQRMSLAGVVHSSLPETLVQIENSPKPFVAALHGNALGGGLEIALAAHYRLAAPMTRLGQPEVTLGFIPGAGGTQRLARLAGIEMAIELCAFGKQITAEEGLACGIIDQIVSNDLQATAISFAKAAAPKLPPRTRDRENKLGSTDSDLTVLAAAHERARKTRRHLIAPRAAISAVAGALLPFEEGMRQEHKLFQQTLVADQAKALIHVFFAERSVSKIPGVPKKLPQVSIRQAAVIGGGTMGRGIAMCYANTGISVILKESSTELLSASMAAIRATYQSAVSRGRLSGAQVDERMARILPQLDFTGFDDVDIVTEAVFENLTVKKDLFAALDQVTRRDCILASNTSYLSIDELAAATRYPQRVIGHHYFSPAHLMRLMEVVPGSATTSEVIASTMALAKKLGKIGTWAGNGRGFIGNRMLQPYRREAQFLVEEGATPQQVDAALENWGMAMGPFAVQDLAGLDIAVRNLQAFAHLENPGMRRPLVIEKLHALGRYGQKTGLGWYRYGADRKPQPDQMVTDIIAKAATEARIPQRQITDEEIIERTIFSLINEGAKVLEEGRALRGSDIDVVYINGYGFPSWRGGPMCYGDSLGLPRVHERLCEFETTMGQIWTPAPLVARLAATAGSFAGWDAKHGPSNLEGRAP